MIRANDNRQWWLLPIAALILLGLTTSQGAVGDELEERLVSVGLKIFPAVIAADSSLETNSPDTPIHIAVVYSDNQPYAEIQAKRLSKVNRIKGHKLTIKVLSIEQLLSQGSPPDALFLSQRLDEQLADVISYSRKHNVISFSPFRGDVENGVLAGITVTDRILPYINLQTLSNQALELKPFFLKVAETYAP